MSARTHPGSLSSAHLRIIHLLDELNTTVESVEELARSGDAEAAIKLVDDQRATLYSVVDSISKEVAFTRRRWDVIRRNASALAAAAILAVSGVAGAVGIMSHGDGSTNGSIAPSGGTAPASPALGGLEAGSSGPVSSSGGAGAQPPLVDGGPRSGGDITGHLPPAPDPNDGQGTIGSAKSLADDLQENPQPPSSGQSPIEDVRGGIDTKPLPSKGTARAST